MAYDSFLADRMRQILGAKTAFEEKKMFGGLAFLVGGKMACGIVNNELMVRIVETKYEAALLEPNCRKMDFTGRPLKGFLYVAPEGFDADRDLSRWIDEGLEFVRQTH
ncbi:MAG TPA: TfoX/Sxy family protein [Saprospiraceae bacterium]|nr:TfoX/Sxy family protein [Saprospiraceae bacterium]